ncbi:MAG: Glutamyl-tRNA(Gln) amidotransferase subunit [Planctomycetota bacterium]|jgi:aspartyl-tRNA(Asn)/glutamyl-tRNA(Gln) amidotransferase subunit C
MSISSTDIQRVAHLARLQLSETELESYSVQMKAIVEFVDQLQGVDTSGVEPMVHAIELTNVLADDQVRNGLSREQALANSPDHDEECFRVPAVLG